MNTETVKNETGKYTLLPPVDIYETENEFIVKADVPGVKKEDIEITLNDNKLEIRGKVSGNEREDAARYREYTLYDFYRSFNVGNDIDANGITAQTENGVITLMLKKREEVKPRKIEVIAG